MTKTPDPVVLLHGFTGSAEAMNGLSEGLRQCLSEGLNGGLSDGSNEGLSETVSPSRAGSYGGSLSDGSGDGLSETHRLFAIDLPGHGNAATPHAIEHFSMEATVSHLWDALDALRVERANLIGYSMGGRVALSAAVACPNRVAKVVCLGASPGIADPIERNKRKLADEALADSILADGVEQFVDSWLRQPLFASLAQRLSPADFQATREQRLANSPRGLTLSLRGIGTGAMEPLHEPLADADFPCLWVAGAEDAKFAAIAEEMSKAMPKGSRALIPDAGHSAHLENPAATLSAIASFLAAHCLADAQT